jgi:ferredoxin
MKCISPAFCFESKTNRFDIDRAKNKYEKIRKFRFIIDERRKRIEPFKKY